MGSLAPPTAGRPERAPRHRPLVPVLAGAAVGIAMDGLLAPPVWFWLAAGLGILIPALWGLRRGLRQWGNWALALMLVVPVAGAYHAMRFRLQPPWHLSNMSLEEGGLYRVEGRVASSPRSHHRSAAYSPRGAGAGRFWAVRVKLDGLTGAGERRRRTAGGLTLFSDRRPDVRAGDRVRATVRLHRNRPPTNPGQPDAATRYARRGNHATARLADPGALEVLHRAPWYSSPGVMLERFRSLLDRRLTEHLRARGAEGRGGIVRALMLGERSALTGEQAELLKQSGTLHFLAISGLHVGIFCVFVAYLTAWVGLGPRLRSLLTIGLVWVYVLLTGAHTSAVRAAWMISFLLAAPLLQRQRDSLSALMGAALLILVAAPQQLFNPGFQLTFVAVWAMVVIYPQLAGILWPWQDFLARAQAPEERTVWSDLWAYARSYLALSVSIWLATAPIRAYHFNCLSFVAPLLNLVVWPLVLLLLIVGFVLLLALAAVPWAAGPLVGGALLLSGDIELLLRFARYLPGFGVYLPSPAPWWVLLFYAALTIWAVRGRLWRGRWGFVVLVLALGLTYVWDDAAVRMSRAFRMVIMDVGRGQCIMVQVPEGQDMLFGAGSSRPSEAQTAAGVLWARHVRSLDAIVVSRMGMERSGFLPLLARRFGVGHLVLPEAPEGDGQGEAARRALGGRLVHVHELRDGRALTGGGLICEALHPDRRFARNPALSDNDRSLVLRCEYGELSFVLPADIGEAAMRRLTRDHPDKLRADLLVMPDHGAYAEGLEELLDSVRPAVAVVSGPRGGVAPRTLAALAERSIPLWITGRDGAVLLRFAGRQVELGGYASGRRMRFDPDLR